MLGCRLPRGRRSTREWSLPPPPQAGLGVALQQAFTIAPGALLTPEAIPESSWHQAWSIPPVLSKTGLQTALQQSFTIDAPYIFGIVNVLRGYTPWSEPVRQKIGLKAYLQQFLAHEPRAIGPTPVTMTLSATETNSDIFAGAIFVGEGLPPTSAIVSVEEGFNNSDPTSVYET